MTTAMVPQAGASASPAPSTPSLPRALESLLDGGVTANGRWQAPAVTPQQAEVIEVRYIPAVERALVPAENQELTGRIVALLSQYGGFRTKNEKLIKVMLDD